MCIRSLDELLWTQVVRFWKCDYFKIIFTLKKRKMIIESEGLK